MFTLTNNLSDEDFTGLCVLLCQCAYENLADELAEAEKCGDENYGWTQLSTTSYILACFLAQRYGISVPTEDPFVDLKMDKARTLEERRRLVSDWMHSAYTRS